MTTDGPSAWDFGAFLLAVLLWTAPLSLATADEKIAVCVSTPAPSSTDGFVDPADKRQAVVPQLRNTLARKDALIVRPFCHQARVQLEITEAIEGTVTGQRASGATDEYKGLRLET